MKAKNIVGVVAANKSFLSKVPALFKMLRASLRGTYRPGRKNIVIFLFLILYLLSPIDLIPDFLIGIGFLDDFAVAFFAFSKLFKEVDKFLEWERQKNSLVVVE